MDNNTEKNTEGKEIDLIDLFNNMMHWFGRKFYGLILFFARNRWSYAILIVIAIIGAVLQVTTSKKIYKCNMLVQSYSVKASEAISFVNNLNFNALGNDAFSNNVKSIYASFVLDYNRDEVLDAVEQTDKNSIMQVRDTALINKRMSNIVSINFELIDNGATNVEHIEDGVLDVLNKNKTFVEYNNLFLDLENDVLTTINNEIIKLDSMRLVEYFQKDQSASLNKNGGLVFMSEKEKKLYHKDMLDLVSKKHDAERLIKLSDEPFKIIQNISVPQQEANSLSYYLKLYIIIAVLGGTFFVFLFDRRKQIKELIKEAESK